MIYADNFEPKPTVFTKLDVEVGSREVVTRQGDKDDEWDHDDTSTDWWFKSAHLTKNQEDYSDAIYPGFLEAGDVVHIVWAVWSTGDSFGRSEHGQMEVISVHKDPVVALNNRKSLEDCQNHGPVNIYQDDGSVYQYYVGWNEYFESLSYVQVQTAMVQLPR